MRKAELVAILLALLGALPMLPDAGLAQEAGDAYNDYFGWEEDGANDPKPEPEGPKSLKEAREQGRGFRIGGAGRLGPTAAGNREVHVVEDGDTLWGISDKYYGDPWHWPELWSFNPEITNPHWIYPLDQVRLSTGRLEGDQAIAQGGGFIEGGPNSGQLSGTEAATSVIVPRELRTPGSVFLRDEGYLDHDALKTAGQIVGGNEEQMLLSTSDQVYVKFKGDQDVRAGQSYAIFRDIYDWERDPNELGKLVRIHGTVVIRSYDRQKRIARGVLTESLDPIERGFYVAQIDRRFDLVAPKRNTATVVAHVIASVRPRSLLSYDNVVFLDVGEGHGIQAGNRFFVVRRGDEWLRELQSDPEDMGNMTPVPTYDENELPKEVVAELRVVKVRKTTTIAIVTRSDTDIFLGDTAELRPGF